MKKQELKGRWKIQSWRQEYDDGRCIHPFGESLDGFIEYGEETIFCLITKKPRKLFSTGGQWDAADVEKAAAYNEYLTYSGRYEFDGDTVIHNIDLCLFPNWQGTSQKRKVIKQGANEITLVARIEEGTKEARTAILAWRRESEI
jgi:hypothetical protein